MTSVGHGLAAAPPPESSDALFMTYYSYNSSHHSLFITYHSYHSYRKKELLFVNSFPHE